MKATNSLNPEFTQKIRSKWIVNPGNHFLIQWILVLLFGFNHVVHRQMQNLG